MAYKPRVEALAAQVRSLRMLLQLPFYFSANDRRLVLIAAHAGTYTGMGWAHPY
jgi:hypothetical protein